MSYRNGQAVCDGCKVERNPDGSVKVDANGAAIVGQCSSPEVAYLDNKGFVYCARCGLHRKESRGGCRKLRPHEARKLQRGEALSRY